MEFDLTETQKLFKTSARELFTQECPSVLVRDTTEKDVNYGGKLWKQFIDQGWTGLIFPESVGGMALGMVELVVAFEEMGRALVPGPILSTVPFAGSLLQSAGSDAQQEKHLKAICDSGTKATVAVLEETANWDPEAVKLKATRSGDGVKLSGKKLFVTDAGEASLIITAARSGSDIVLALVDRKAPGLTVSAMPGMDTLRPMFEVAFDNVEVAGSDLLAGGEDARSHLSHAIDVATLALAAEMVGGMQFILDASVEYAKTRKQFGKPIGQFQAIQHHCANMLLMTESARSAVYYAAWILESDPAGAPLAVSIAKTYVSDSYRETGNLGVQVHGGIGFTWDHELHFYYKRSKSSEFMFGDATFHRERIAHITVDKAHEPTKAVGQSGD